MFFCNFVSFEMFIPSTRSCSSLRKNWYAASLIWNKPLSRYCRDLITWRVSGLSVVSSRTWWLTTTLFSMKCIFFRSRKIFRRTTGDRDNLFSLTYLLSNRKLASYMKKYYNEIKKNHQLYAICWFMLEKYNKPAQFLQPFSDSPSSNVTHFSSSFRSHIFYSELKRFVLLHWFD